jgi:hypothetical protein
MWSSPPAPASNCCVARSRSGCWTGWGRGAAPPQKPCRWRPALCEKTAPTPLACRPRPPGLRPESAIARPDRSAAALAPCWGPLPGGVLGAAGAARARRVGSDRLVRPLRPAAPVRTLHRRVQPPPRAYPPRQSAAVFFGRHAEILATCRDGYLRLILHFTESNDTTFDPSFLSLIDNNNAGRPAFSSRPVALRVVKRQSVGWCAEPQ